MSDNDNPVNLQSHNIQSDKILQHLIAPHLSDFGSEVNFRNNKNVQEATERRLLTSCSVEDKHETIVTHTSVDKSLTKGSCSGATVEGRSSEVGRCGWDSYISEIEDINHGIAATSTSYVNSRSKFVLGRLPSPAVADEVSPFDLATSQMVLPKRMVKILSQISSVAQNFPEYFSDSLLTSSLLSVSGPSSFSDPLHFYIPPPCSD